MHLWREQVLHSPRRGCSPHTRAGAGAQWDELIVLASNRRRMIPSPAMHHGSCLCGSVRYELHAELGDFGFCHCKSCQKASGSAHAANAPIEREHFHLIGGSETLREYESSPGKFRVFCSRCGSPIYAYLAASPDVLRIRLGSLDSEFAQQPRVHSFVSEKAAWASIADDIPQFPEWAPKSALVQRGSKQR